MNHLLRPLAPVSDSGWKLLDDEATERLTAALAARKLVEFSGPHGWEHSATNLGRASALASAPCEGIVATQRRVLPLAELRSGFKVSLSELRDHDRGRVSDLDDAEGLRTWRGRLTDLALDGLLEVATARIDGALAAHVVGVRDSTTYRVLEGHYVTAWGRYAPGRLLEAAVVQKMLDEPDMIALDWMTSVAPESLLATNASASMVVLRAGLGRRA